jgi:hypothetical protein
MHERVSGQVSMRINVSPVEDAKKLYKPYLQKKEMAEFY